MSQLMGMFAVQGPGVDARAYWNSAVHDHVVRALKQHRTAVIDIANQLMESRELSGSLLEEFCARIEVVP